MILTAAMAVMALLGFLAMAVPARRALAIDPAQLLRE
jgi:ABC-type antimicrobial peptide transport system permease subunit